MAKRVRQAGETGKKWTQRARDATASHFDPPTQNDKTPLRGLRRFRRMTEGAPSDRDGLERVELTRLRNALRHVVRVHQAEGRDGAAVGVLGAEGVEERDVQLVERDFAAVRAGVEADVLV